MSLVFLQCSGVFNKGLYVEVHGMDCFVFFSIELAMEYLGVSLVLVSATTPLVW